MPRELITSTTVTDDHVYTQSLHIAWGVKGGAPEAPDGWVNAGYAQVQLSEDHGQHGHLTGVNLDPDEIGHLIRVLKRVKRQAFPMPKRDETRFIDADGHPLAEWSGNPST